MSTNSESVYYSDPTVRFLEQILMDVHKGKVLVPKFQRPFLWTSERQLDLFDSIVRGLPIGSIMYWTPESSNLNIPCTNIFGKDRTNLQNHTEIKYILDGLQRISTLYCSLIKFEDADKEHCFEKLQTMYYDLEEKKFAFLKKRESYKPYWLPVNIMLDSVALLKFNRNLISNLFDSSEDIDGYIHEADKICSAMRSYKIPVIPIITDSVELVTDTFRKINSKGMGIKEEDMLHALSWNQDFSFNDSISELTKDYFSETAWENLSRDLVIKVIMLSKGFGVYKIKNNIIKLKDFLKDEPNMVEHTFHSINKAKDFFRSCLGISSPIFIPYELQIIFVASIFYKGIHTLNNNNLFFMLEKWFWLTTYTEAFSGMSDDKIKTSLSDLQDSIISGGLSWSNDKVQWRGIDRKPNFDFRSVRSKSYILMLSRLRDQQRGSLKTGVSLQEEHGKKALGSVFSEKYVLPNSSKRLKRYSNKIFYTPDSFPIDVHRLVSSEEWFNEIFYGIVFYSEVYNEFLCYGEEAFLADDFLDFLEDRLFEMENKFAHEQITEFWDNRIDLTIPKFD